MFRLKTAALAATMAAAALSAQASDVEVFGRLDTGVLYTVNQGDSKDTLQMSTGRSTGSRWGLKATEDLGNDWQVVAHLESGISSDTGEFCSSCGSRIFGRQMTLSLKNNSFGKIAFGRSGKPLSGSDEFTRIRAFTPFGVTYGDAGLLFYGKGGRVDNGVFYQSPRFAGLTAVLAASTQTSNQEEPEWTDNTRFWGGSLDWKGGNLGLIVGAEQIVVARADKETKDNPTTLLMGAYYDFGFMKLMAAYQKGWDLDRIGAFQGGSKLTIGGKNSIVRYFDADFYMLGATVPAGKGLVRLSALYMTGENAQRLANNSVSNDETKAGYWAVAAGYTYPFSKRTSVYGTVSYLQGTDALDKKYKVTTADGDLMRYQFAVGLVHKF